MHYSCSSKVTARSQTTIPRAVRDALDLHPGDRVGYVIDGDVVRLVKVQEVAHHDPALESFLALLQRDIITRPDRVVGVPAELLARMTALSVGVVVDHDVPIDGTVAS
jgi:antitoxin PrlF